MWFWLFSKCELASCAVHRSFVFVVIWWHKNSRALHKHNDDSGLDGRAKRRSPACLRAQDFFVSSFVRFSVVFRAAPGVKVFLLFFLPATSVAVTSPVACLRNRRSWRSQNSPSEFPCLLKILPRLLPSPRCHGDHPGLRIYSYFSSEFSASKNSDERWCFRINLSLKKWILGSDVVPKKEYKWLTRGCCHRNFSSNYDGRDGMMILSFEDFFLLWFKSNSRFFLNPHDATRAPSLFSPIPRFNLFILLIKH